MLELAKLQFIIMIQPGISLPTKLKSTFLAAIDRRSNIISTTVIPKPVPPELPIKPIIDQPGQFVSILAHELRNPLTNILLSVKMLESAILDEELKIFLDIITRSSVRINILIKELIKYQESDELPEGKHSIHELLDETVKMAADRISLRHISIIKTYGARDFNMMVNRSKLKIALTNIIVNAIDSMKSENGILKLVTKSIDGQYVLEIEDNGCGIAAENLKSIFNSFYTNKPGGLGLGLAMTRDILRANHIETRVESIVGTGTRFTLIFATNKKLIS
jgi:signal transduction histidine kinase